METCPHGKRILCAPDAPVVFVDDCGTCEAWLSELGFSALLIPRETITAA